MGNTLSFILGQVKNRKYAQANNTAVSACDKPILPEHNHDMLFSDLIEEWFFHHKYKIMESTAYGYKKIIPCVQAYFGGVFVNDIDTEMIYNYINYLKNGTISESSMKIYYKVVQLSLRYALMYRYISYNPASEIILKKPPRVEIKPFSEAEFNLLITAPGPDWLRNSIIIAFRTGMRPGEIFALKWSDIDLEQRYISVQRSISRASSNTTLKTTKTPTGVRRIDIDSKLTALLTGMRKDNPEETYVFPGTPRSKKEYRVPWNLSSELRKMCEKVNIPPRNFYALRHTHASVLLSHGVHPKIVQERLGHSSCKITMDTYSHVAPTIQRDAVNVMEDI